MYKGKVKVSSIDLLILILINTFFSYFTTSIYTLIRYVLTMYLFIKYYKEMKGSILLYSMLLIYSFLLGLSSYINNNSITWGLSGFMHGLRLICIFTVISGVLKKREVNEVVTTMINIIIWLLIPTDLFIFFYPYKILSTTVYLIGNKFYVSYMHSLLILLVSIKWGANKKVLLFLTYLLSIIITIRIKCTTGVLMIIVCFLSHVMVYMFPLLKKAVCHIGLIAIGLLVINILIWGASAILYTPWATHIIVDILGKSSNMTGRFQLYNVIPELIKNESFIGYGFQTDIFRILFGYGNAQNGLIQIVLESGIFGAIVYFFSLFLAGRKGDNNIQLYAIYLYLLSFIIGSVSEINLSNFFVFGIALLFTFGSKAKKQKEFKRL